MKTFRVTLQAVLDVEANSEEEAWNELPDYIDTGDMYILDTEEIEGENE